MNKCKSCGRETIEGNSLCELCSKLEDEFREIADRLLEYSDKERFIRLAEIMVKEKIWDSETIVSFYTSAIYGDNYNSRDFTYDLRPKYIDELSILKDLTKSREIRKELQDTIDECERIQMGGMC